GDIDDALGGDLVARQAVVQVRHVRLAFLRGTTVPTESLIVSKQHGRRTVLAISPNTGNNAVGVARHSHARLGLCSADGTPRRTQILAVSSESKIDAAQLGARYIKRRHPEPMKGKVTQTRGIELEARGLVLCHLGGETCAVEIVANALQGDVHVQPITNERLCGFPMDLDVGLVPVQYEPNEEPNGVLRQGLRPARSL